MSLLHYKSLYYGLLTKARLIKHGFENSSADSLFFVPKQGANIVYILVFVDDILMTDNNPSLTHSCYKIGVYFALKDLGNLNYFLGIQVDVQVSQGLVLSQAEYAKDPSQGWHV